MSKFVTPQCELSDFVLLPLLNLVSFATTIILSISMPVCFGGGICNDVYKYFLSTESTVNG